MNGVLTLCQSHGTNMLYIRYHFSSSQQPIGAVPFISPFHRQETESFAHVHTVSRQWRQCSSTGLPNIKYVPPSPTVCAGPVFPSSRPGNGLCGSEMLKTFPGRVQALTSPWKAVKDLEPWVLRKPPSQADWHTSTVICKPDSGLSVASPSRGHCIRCLKVKHFLKHLLEIVCH